jgi:hypothetical protein
MMRHADLWRAQDKNLLPHAGIGEHDAFAVEGGLEIFVGELLEWAPSTSG